MRNLAVSEHAGSGVAGSRTVNSTSGKRWWQWPSLLALDAPVVALVWLYAFSNSAIEPVRWPVATGLFLAVWCIYLADRLIDARCLNDLLTASDRHRFARENWRGLSALFATTGIAGAWLAWTWIDGELLKAAVNLLLAVGLYFGGFVRKWRHTSQRILPAKEIACGLVFAIGCALGVDSIRESPLTFLPMVLLFGGVCAFNCLLISAWEKSSDRNNDPAAASRWWKSLDRDLVWIGVLLTGICAGSFVAADHGTIFLAMSGASALLTVLHLGRNRAWLSVAVRRVLADVVLLTPLVIQFSS